MSRVFRAMLSGVLIISFLLIVPAAVSQNGCEPFKVPPGREWGDFISNIWFTDGDIALSGDTLHAFVTIYPGGEFPALLGNKGNTMKGTETAVWDFGSAGSFQTNINFTVQHNNDPAKWTMTATEIIIPGSGTGRFAGVTGHFADQGSFWMTDWETAQADGWFVTHGMICGVAAAD